MPSASLQTKILSIVVVYLIGSIIQTTVVYSTTPDTLEASDYREVMSMKDLIADTLPPPVYLVEAQRAVLGAARSQDAAERSALHQRWTEIEREYQGRHSYWSEHLKAGELRTVLLEQNHQSVQRMFAVGDGQFWPALESGDRARAESALDELHHAFVAHRAIIDRVVELTNKEVTRHTEAAASTIHARKLTLLGLAVGIAVVGAFVALQIARSISRRSRDMANTLEQVASGDLAQRAEIDAQDELGRMATQLNATLEAIERVFGEVRSVAGSLAEAASKLAQSSDSISQGAQQQAASLEETAASLEEITATVKQSAGNAQQADTVAVGSRDVAERGGSVVAGAISAMDEITKASRRIGDIITTIDEIALQTNLLALNAAVEAARAGEQGRGFAVVASEVGNLAQRSAAAAKEVKSLIQDSLERIQAGHQLVGESGRALNDIIVSVKKVTDIVGEIASAAREQSIGVDQVNQAVSQMDQVTQSNAAQTDQLSHTAQGLAENAEQLTKLLTRFRLSTEESTSFGSGGSGARPVPLPLGKKRSARRVAPRHDTYDAGPQSAANDNMDDASDFEVLSSGGARGT
ncbi:MAG: methyl-accepting chemotaxis protein [Polyangiales bacterium]